MGEKPIVHLMAYVGKELNYDANGSIKNEKTLIKLRYNTVEWVNFMKHLSMIGYLKVEVKNVVDVSIKDGKEVAEPLKDFSDITEEVKKAFSPTVEVVKTPEQKRIDELEEKLQSFTDMAPKYNKSAKKENVDADKEEIKALRVRYRDLYKKGHGPKWSVEKLKEMIATKEAEQGNE